METIHSGVVSRGFQIASGKACGREKDPSPFSAGSLSLQHPHLVEKGVDLTSLVPNLEWGTINLELGRKLVLVKPDLTRTIDWSRDEPDPAARVGPETFSFVRCCFIYGLEPDEEQAYYPGVIYYPHPETKPETNRHNFDAIEVITSFVPNLRYGTRASVVCRANAFEAL